MSPRLHSLNAERDRRLRRDVKRFVALYRTPGGVAGDWEEEDSDDDDDDQGDDAEIYDDEVVYVDRGFVVLEPAEGIRDPRPMHLVPVLLRASVVSHANYRTQIFSENTRTRWGLFSVAAVKQKAKIRMNPWVKETGLGTVQPVRVDELRLRRPQPEGHGRGRQGSHCQGCR